MKLSLIDFVMLTRKNADAEKIIENDCIANYFGSTNEFALSCPVENDKECSCKECWYREFELEGLIKAFGFVPYNKRLPSAWKEEVLRVFGRIY